jgi:hypothetical protein
VLDHGGPLAQQRPQDTHLGIRATRGLPQPQGMQLLQPEDFS